MKKLLSIILSTLCLIFSFLGCSERKNAIIPTNDYHTDYKGIYITIESVDTMRGLNLNVRWHNETDYELVYTLPYQIEYKNGEEWVNIQTEDLNYAYSEITIAPKSTKTQVYSTAGFDVSKTGVYRLRENCKILTDDMVSCNLWVEFNVKKFSMIEAIQSL